MTKCYFNKDKKKELLKGRTIRYLAREELHCTDAHLTNILNGKSSCTYSTAKNIVSCVNGNVEDYFDIK